ncbi:MAG TPA: tRNA (adenosine(37)-N6)-threonylcarbamoyltransferase complex dimerization subunit type 1 TsaB [Solirubrobacterales bacterium]|nr:tRNA (adenosine(37)-N6)-threonylcarbamoyltransferase complex dimerization subunit type 1 TsaB [Solirubrobacterales bacterium]
MIVVALDTATDDTAVAALRDGEVVHEALVGPGEAGGRPSHNTALLPGIEEAAAAAGGWQEVDRIAVGVGPGSFTGLRIGISTARGLGTALGKPLAPVGTLDALARGIGEEAPDRGRLAILDARRGEVFAALWDVAGAPVWPPAVSSPEELASRIRELDEPPLAAGSGALRFREELAGSGADVPTGASPLHRIAARHLGALGAAGDGVEPEAVEPIYLRPPDAERWRERDS